MNNKVGHYLPIFMNLTMILFISCVISKIHTKVHHHSLFYFIFLSRFFLAFLSRFSFVSFSFKFFICLGLFALNYFFFHTEFTFLVENALEMSSIRQKISDFVISLKQLAKKKIPPNKLAEVVHEKIDLLTISFSSRTSLKSWPKPIISECVEQYILSHTYSVLFSLKPEDKMLSQRLAQFNTFIELKHLDINENLYDQELWKLAQEHLKQLSSANSPRQKILIIVV